MANNFQANRRSGNAADQVTRRQFVAQVSGLATASYCFGNLFCANAGAAPGEPYRIDTHHHVYPPEYLRDVQREIAYELRGVSTDAINQWSPQAALQDMDENGIATSVMSVSTPGVYFGDIDRGRRLARQCNEYGARMIADYPGRFGMFAAIPLPDVEGSLREIEYALDVLNLDGIGLLTSYQDRWPGESEFFPVFEELNRRKATVYFHPTAPFCCTDLVPHTRIFLELPTDTARCAASLYIGGVLSRCQDINFIFSHGGGSLPSFAHRLNFVNYYIDPPWPRSPLEEFQRLHYDTAAILNPPAMAALLQLVPPSQIVMGSDFPWRSTSRAVNEIRDLGLFSDAELLAIERDNAVALMPQLSL